MAKPTLLTVDDDPEVLRAIERDLKRRYGGDYRVLRADSGVVALDTLKQLKVRNEPVALLLVDQRMPRMAGVEFLEAARELYPEARRVLLTAYADTEAAIRAINHVKLDHYLLKPWDPPEEKLFPTLDDLLDDWKAHFCPPFQGIRVLGHRWSPEAHRVKDFLARNRVPYQWIDIEAQAEDTQTRSLLEAIGPDLPGLPLVLFADGSCMVAPSNAQIAEKVGLRTHAEKPFYDLAIVGAGPTGLAAAVYGASEGLSTVLIEREAPGGQAGTSSRIENYLGFPQGISGDDLARRAADQARKFGAEILTQEAVGVRVEDPYRILTLADGNEISCYALVIATGVSWRKFNAPGIERLTGKGVYYGAARTEAPSCKGEHVYLIGGANSAGQAAMYFSEYADKVTMLVRADSLAKSMSQYLIEQIEATPNIEVCTLCSVVGVEGEENLERITIANAGTGTQETVAANSLFIFIGAEPLTDWLDGVVERDDHGFLFSGPDLIHDGKRPKGWLPDRFPYLLETSVPGIFTAGDVRHGSIKRCAAGVGTGSMTVQFVHQYLSEVRGGQ